MNYRHKLNGLPIAIITGGMELVYANEKAQAEKAAQQANQVYIDFLKAESRKIDEIEKQTKQYGYKTSDILSEAEEKNIRKEKIIHNSIIAGGIILVIGGYVLYKSTKRR